MLLKRFESICSGVDSAAKNGDIVEQYRQTFVLLMLILEEHRRLVEVCTEIERTSSSLNTLPTKLHSNEYTHHSGRSGWGNRGNGYTVGHWSGSVLRPIIPVNVNDYHNRIAELCLLQMQYNDDLLVLQQFCAAFKTYRKTLLGTKVRNKIQRECQNILLVSVCGISWERKEITTNSVWEVVNGEFARLANVSNILFKLKTTLNDKKGLIGRESYGEGYYLVGRSGHYRRPSKDVADRYSGKADKHTRCCMVENYVSKSKRYQSRLDWIVGIYDVSHALPIMRYVDDWKVKYAATNKLAYLNAANETPYVKSIVSSQLTQVGTIEHLETQIPVYSASCLCWQSRKSDMVQTVYFLGKSGSRIVDGVASKIEWYHVSGEQTELSRLQGVDYLRQRLGYARDTTLSLKQRRLEIARYARKLVWLETMSMLDSKTAGNCLPGTIQFAKQLGIPCPDNWTDYRVDTRLILRQWKKHSYGVNRLLLPAIDAAVNRVKQTLCQLTATYVPNGVK